jgi:hypothetical protein
LPETLLGKKVRCKSCEQVFIIGQPQEAAPMVALATSRAEAAESIQSSQRVSRPPVVLRPANEPREPHIRRKPSRTGIPPLVWIAGGFAAAVFFVVVAGVIAFLVFFKGNANDSFTNPVASISSEKPQDSSPPQRVNPAADAPQNQLPPPPVPPRFPPGGNQPPPNNRPPEQNPGQGFQVTLSNGRVGQAIGLRRTFTISYKFERGGPAIGQQYFLVIKTPTSTAEARFSSIQMASQGTFQVQELGFAAKDKGPFEAHLETGFPGPIGPREVVSNTIKLSQ